MLVVLAMAMLASACGTGTADSVAESAPSTTVEPTSSTPEEPVESVTPASTVDAAPSTTAAVPTTAVTTDTTAAPAADSTTTPATTTPPTTLATPAPACTRVTDFATAAQQQSWRVTLDGVMGGLSSGQVEFVDDTMVFTGEIVTQGGGFSLLRTGLDFDAFADGSYLQVRARADGRRYEMVFKDSLEGRRGSLFHEADVSFVDSDDWQEVRVELDGLRTTINGRPIDTEPFDKDRASEMGVILKDGVDGEFRIELDWVDVCAEPQ